MSPVLALDVGSSSVRAQRFGEDGQPLDELKQEHYDGHDPDEIVELVRTVVAGRDEDVDAVGTSCFAHSLVGLDEADRPTTPVLGWRDTRSAEEAEWLRGRVSDADDVHTRTGAPIHPSFWPAKLAWLAEAQPEVFQASARFVSFSDYLYAELLGVEPVTSLSMASGTGLLDLATGDWDPELLGILGLGEDHLPPISDEPQDGWHPALLDAVCSNLGAGCVGTRRAALMIGTSGALRLLYTTEQPRPKPGLFIYRLDAHRVLEGGALSDGGNLYAWLRKTLAVAEGPLLDRSPDEHGLTFLPFLGGERSTGWNPDATGSVSGLTFDTTADDIRQAALEGVAFRFAAIADLLPGLEDVVATGGALLAHPEWIQVIADALARPVTVSAVKEGSLRGAAVAVLERLGYEAASAPLGNTFQPREALAEAYRSARERHRRLYEELRGED